jgi:alcohol dehydrogenase class IV
VLARPEYGERPVHDFALDFPDGFTWRDGERTVRFAPGALARAPEILAEHSWDRYELLSTRRGLESAYLELPEGAVAVHEVPSGPVPDAAAELLSDVTVPTLVALGGGRVIDTAKAIAAVRGGRVCAIPTTLSGAEMTAIHRLPEGHPAPHLVRPALVIADPDLMVSQPELELRASAMNALGHGADSLYTPYASPVSRLTALQGAGLIARALDQEPGRRDRPALALGALLCGFAIDSALFAFHHVVCQSLVRVMKIPHAETNAAVLPRAMEAMRPRAPDAIAALAEELGTEPGGIRTRIEELAGGRRSLQEIGADSARLEQAVDEIEARPQLRFTPEPPDRDELRTLIEAAW